MRITFVGLSSHYTTGMAYQDNLLLRACCAQGHEVTYISDCGYYREGVLETASPGSETLPEGGTLIRLPFDPVLGPYITEKLRKCRALEPLLAKLRPELLFHHGTCGLAIREAAVYKKKHPETVFSVDCHETFFTSARNALSRNVLHRGLYRTVFRQALPCIDHLYYVGGGERVYLRDMMGVPEEKMELLPLGGLLPAAEEKQEARARLRQELRAGEETVVFLHSGKLDAKKKTAEILRCFRSLPQKDLRLVIVGRAGNAGDTGDDGKDLQRVLEESARQDPRIVLTGWKTAAELREYLCAADLYLQPGMPSVTMQTALCCGTPVLINAQDGYYDHLPRDGGFAFLSHSEEDLRRCMEKAAGDKTRLSRMGERAEQFAGKELDYAAQATKITQAGTASQGERNPDI